VLYLNHLGDAGAAEDVLAVGNDRIGQGLHANGALLLALYDKLESLLQESAILVVEHDYILVLEKLHQIGDAILAQGPVVASCKS
jgi:hypothetical protein